LDNDDGDMARVEEVGMVLECFSAVPGALADGPADLEALHVVVLVVAVSGLAEADLEGHGS
jgi:hypothetical protein